MSCSYHHLPNRSHLSLSSTGGSLEDGSFNLQEPEVIKLATDGRGDGSPRAEGFPDGGVCNHVQVPLPVSLVDISEPMELVREREDGLGEHLPGFAVYSEFPLVSATNGTGNANDVPAVGPRLQVFEGVSVGSIELGRGRGGLDSSAEGTAGLMGASAGGEAFEIASKLLFNTTNATGQTPQ
jgi:hypothetical protein